MKRLFIFSISLLLAACSGCSNTPTPKQQAKLDALIAKTKQELIPIKGGSFMMGDFCDSKDYVGKLDSEKDLPCTSETDDDVLHEVVLDDFKMQKHKVTIGDYDVFTALTGRQKILNEKIDRDWRLPKFIAGVKWQAARDYCQWLGGHIGQPLELPTEAQWEYAARNNGEYRLFFTHNGLYRKKGFHEPENGEEYSVLSYDEAKKTPPIGSSIYIIGSTKALPNGLMDFENGYEWVLDDYAADYYQRSPKHNPVNITQSKDKVTRGAALGNFSSFSHKTTARNKTGAEQRIWYRDRDDTSTKIVQNNYLDYGFRCVSK